MDVARLIEKRLAELEMPVTALTERLGFPTINLRSILSGTNPNPLIAHVERIAGAMGLRLTLGTKINTPFSLEEIDPGITEQLKFEMRTYRMRKVTERMNVKMPS